MGAGADAGTDAGVGAEIDAGTGTGAGAGAVAGVDTGVGACSRGAAARVEAGGATRTISYPSGRGGPNERG